MTAFRTLAVAAALVAGALTSSTAFAGQRHQDDYERWVDIVNDSDLAIFHVNISNVEVTTWGRDLLASDEVIMGGDTQRLEPRRPNGYCRFDVRVTYEDDTEVQVRNVNLCKATAIVVGDDGYSDVEFN